MDWEQERTLPIEENFDVPLQPEINDEYTLRPIKIIIKINIKFTIKKPYFDKKTNHKNNITKKPKEGPKKILNNKYFLGK